MTEPDGTFGKTMPKLVGDRFENPWTTWKGLPSFLDFLKWTLFTRKHRNTRTEIERELPVHRPDFHSNNNSELWAMWLGHATVLVQLEGFNVLTDPVFSPRCSPLPFYGPKRYRPPPCTVHDLPQIHAVVISHNHYDHLDWNTVKRLHGRFGHSLRWFVPKGLAGWFIKCGISNAVEMTWWETGEVTLPADTSQQRGEGRMEIVFLPCQHWSLRSGLDRNCSLWGSWAVIGQRRRFYFAGDTGYCPEFENIGAHLGPFDISAIPIGCYSPRHIMRNQHIDPAEAVKIHNDVRSLHSFGIHWGTYDMGSCEAQLAPKADLSKELEKTGLAADAFFTLQPGQMWSVPDPAQ